jgi:hypothetical protein
MDLLRDPTGQCPQVTAGITSWKIIPSADGQVRFLNKSRPQQRWLPPIHNMEGTCIGQWKTIVNRHSPPTTIEMQPNDVFAVLR